MSGRLLAPMLLIAFLVWKPTEGTANESLNQTRPADYGVHHDPGTPRKPRITKPGDRKRKSLEGTRYSQNDHRRAGCPHSVSRWATCSKSPKYGGYFAGGGSPFRLHSRHRRSNGCQDFGEGTWGVDYQGLLGHANVWLRYSDGRRQGGEGAYATDHEKHESSMWKRLSAGLRRSGKHDSHTK